MATLGEFVSRIERRPTPVMSSSAREIAALSSDDERSLSALADVILKDPAMTTHVLRASNTAYAVRQGRTNTVSRAIVTLGFDVVRSICLTCSVLDGLMKEPPRQELINELGRSIHAAIQARHLSLNRGEHHTEETFVATILDKLGALAFWAFGEELADELEVALKNSDAPREEVEEQVLGFTLSELSEVLLELWGFNESVHFFQDSTLTQKRKEMNLCQDLARTASNGWESEEVESVLRELIDSTGLQETVLRHVVQVAAKEAAETASSFGIEDVSRLIPLPSSDGPVGKTGKRASTDEEVRPDEGPAETAADSQTTEAVFEPLEADPVYQLQALQVIATLLDGGGDVTMLFSTLLEGMRRGIGLDRVLVAVLNEPRTQLSAKITSGGDQIALRSDFLFPYDESAHNFFYKLFKSQRSLWAKEAPVEIAEKLGVESFFIAPIIVEQKPIGVFYADMKPSGRDLQDSMFGSFRQFALQGVMGLNHIERRG